MNWGLGIGDWGLGPIPNPQSPIPYYVLFSIIIFQVQLTTLISITKYKY